MCDDAKPRIRQCLEAVLKALAEDGRHAHTAVKTAILDVPKKVDLIVRKADRDRDAEQPAHTNAGQVARSLIVGNMKKKEGSVLLGDLALVYGRACEIKAGRERVSPGEELRL